MVITVGHGDNFGPRGEAERRARERRREGERGGGSGEEAAAQRLHPKRREMVAFLQ